MKGSAMSAFMYLVRYEPSHLAPSGKPELYFVFGKHVFPGFVVRTRQFITSQGDVFKTFHTYFEKETPFAISEERFGFGECAYMKRLGGDWEIRLPMIREHVSHLAATISCIAQCGALYLAPENRAQFGGQQIELNTITRMEMHGHSMWGRVYPALGRWLKAQHGHLDTSVVRAMQSVWKEVCHPGHEEYARECSARLWNDGRFAFECFGDACDLAIYPDEGECDLESGHTRFSCHNLDTASQQLTLLAGLAQMLTIAR
jgi:hypothetical protein